MKAFELRRWPSSLFWQLSNIVGLRCESGRDQEARYMCRDEDDYPPFEYVVNGKPMGYDMRCSPC